MFLSRAASCSKSPISGRTFIRHLHHPRSLFEPKDCHRPHHHIWRRHSEPFEHAAIQINYQFDALQGAVPRVIVEPHTDTFWQGTEKPQGEEGGFAIALTQGGASSRLKLTYDPWPHSLSLPCRPKEMGVIHWWDWPIKGQQRVESQGIPILNHQPGIDDRTRIPLCLGHAHLHNAEKSSRTGMIDFLDPQLLIQPPGSVKKSWVYFHSENSLDEEHDKVISSELSLMWSERVFTLLSLMLETYTHVVRELASNRR